MKKSKSPIIRENYYVKFSAQELEVYNEVKKKVKGLLKHHDKNNAMEPSFELDFNIQKLRLLCSQHGVDYALRTEYSAIDFEDVSSSRDLRKKFRNTLPSEGYRCPICTTHHPTVLLISRCRHTFYCKSLTRGKLA